MAQRGRRSFPAARADSGTCPEKDEMDPGPSLRRPADGAARRRQNQQDAVMLAGFNRRWALASRANLALALALLATRSALADLATPQQKRACTPDVYRRCRGEISNARAIAACLRQQNALGIRRH